MKKKYEKPQIEVIDVAPVEICAYSKWGADSDARQKIYDDRNSDSGYDAFDDVNW